MAVLICVGGFMLISMWIILYIARREDCVFYCKQSKIIEYYETDFRVNSFEATIHTRRYVKILERIKRYANEDFHRKMKGEMRYQGNGSFCYIKNCN